MAIALAILHADLRVPVMGEPTAALGPRQTVRTLRLIENLQDQGFAVPLISHSLADVISVADRIQVMRRGRRVGTLRIQDTTHEEVLEIIVGSHRTAKVA